MSSVLGCYTSPGPGELKYPGLSLDKEHHIYTLNGRVLSGVTGGISKRLKKNFDNDFVDEARGQGSHVHDAIEGFLTTGREISVHPAARWAVAQLRSLQDQGMTLYAEVLITDKKRYASAIDVLCITPTGSILLMDTKAGNFLRESVSWQLGIYKLFLENMTSQKVDRCYCLSTKDSDIYPIIPKSPADVKLLLYGGK